MRVLHTEASAGMGGQELRILKEAIGMRRRGHEIFFAVQKGGMLALKARAEGFSVFELSFAKPSLFKTVYGLLSLIRKYKIDIINTHSSLDAWMGGIAGKLCGIFIIRTRHLSTPVRKGINSKLLYNFLANRVVTTCLETKEMIQSQAALPPERLASIPTGVDLQSLSVDPESIKKIRMSLGVGPEECLVGTLCVLRGWKGVFDLLHTAKLLENVPHLKWVVIGGGVGEEYFKSIWRELKLENKVFFTGHLDSPFATLAALDIFLLLSHANEGVSQATLQAATLKKPLITTRVGGLPEVCVDGITGIQVSTHAPAEVADAVLRLMQAPQLRAKMGLSAHLLVEKKFTLHKMLDDMEVLYYQSLDCKSQ